MTITTIHAPNPNYNGVRAGVAFSGGKAEVDEDTDGSAVAYFRSAGYTVGGDKPDATVGPPVDRLAEAHGTFPGEMPEDRGRADVAVPPIEGAGSGRDQWAEFAQLKGIDDAGSKDAIVKRVRAAGLIT